MAPTSGLFRSVEARHLPRGDAQPASPGALRGAIPAEEGEAAAGDGWQEAPAAALPGAVVSPPAWSGGRILSAHDPGITSDPNGGTPPTRPIAATVIVPLVGSVTGSTSSLTNVPDC